MNATYNLGIANGMYRHGLYRTSEYRAWQAMHQRCTNPKNPMFIYYGARKIKVCESWKSFDNFITDMGNKPAPGYSLERINVDGDYSPENCIWSDNHSQALNRRMRSNSKTGYRGVTWANHAKKYVAHIESGTTKLHLGLFENPEEAALVYDIAAIQLNGNKAKLNLIGDS